MRGRGLPCWWALLLEMLSTCTCYSPRVHAIAGCIGDGSGTCHLLIAQRSHLWFLNVSSFYWTTCCFPVVPHASFLLAHVSCCHWITCHFFIGPRVIFLLVHVSVSYLTMRHNAVRPRGLRFPSTCRIFNSPRVEPWPIHVSCTGWFMCLIFIWSCGLSWFYRVQD